MCIHGFVKFMQNLCSDLKVLRRIQGGIAGGGRRKRHHRCLFLLVGNPAVLDLCLAAQILTGHDSPDYYMQACVDDTFCLLYHHMISMIILSSLRT